MKRHPPFPWVEQMSELQRIENPETEADRKLQHAYFIVREQLERCWRNRKREIEDWAKRHSRSPKP